MLFYSQKVNSTLIFCLIFKKICFIQTIMNFSAKIRAARAILDLKQSEIAVEAGISVPGYQNIELVKVVLTPQLKAN